MHDDISIFDSTRIEGVQTERIYIDEQGKKWVVLSFDFIKDFKILCKIIV